MKTKPNFSGHQPGWMLMIILALLSLSLDAQRTITGTVTDEQQNPLIGANVLLMGTGTGTATDGDGRFNLTIPDGQGMQLEISYTGYNKVILSINKESVYNAALKTGELLEEVVLIGYGSQNKADKTGAVSQVKNTELNTGALSDPIQGLQGKTAGVTISKQGGDPNRGFAVNIRGAAAFTSGTGPLFVIDGVPGADPTAISSQDIASFDILKDAASTSIYGARGSNGVILITTKNASVGKAKINQIEYTGQVSADNVSRRLDLLNSEDIRQFAQKTGRTYIDNGANTDWQDAIYRTGISNEHNLAFTRADENSSFRTSLSHMNLTGVILGSAKSRSTGRVNFAQSLLDNKVNVEARLSGTIEHNDYVDYGNGIAPNNLIYQAIRRSPTDPIYKADGSFFETDRSFQYFNPVAIIKDIQNQRDAKRYYGNLRTEVNILHNLKGAINLGYIRNDDESFYFEPSTTASNSTKGYARRAYNNYQSGVIESTLKYKLELGHQQTLDLLGGHSYQIDTYDGFAAQGKDAQSNYLTSNNLASLLLLEPGSISSYKNESLLASFFGRASWQYHRRYYLTASLRRDGSSKFGKNNESGWFPAVSAAWNLTSESFMRKQNIFNDLKLRVGYGITGNQNIPTNVDAIYFAPAGTAINPETGVKVISFQNAGGVNPNPDLKWEENRELNIGIDFGVWNNRLNGSLELYNKKTSDLIYNYELPVPPNKNRYIFANAGEIVNKGVELSLQAFLIDHRNFDWRSNFVFAANRQNTVRLTNDKYDLDQIKTLYVSGRGLVGGENYTQIIKPGEEIGTFYLPQYAGLSSDGKFLFYTAEGGVTRDVTKAQRRVVGHAQPRFTLGWSNYFSFLKNFEAGISLRAVLKYDVLNVTRMVFSNPSDLPTLNTLREALSEYDRGLTSSPVVSSYYLEDASFLKVDNVSLTYILRKTGIDHIKSIRFSLSGLNLYTLTGYKGVDPELSYGGIEFGRDQYDVYPKTRSISFGINAIFE